MPVGCKDCNTGTAAGGRRAAVRGALAYGGTSLHTTRRFIVGVLCLGLTIGPGVVASGPAIAVAQPAVITVSGTVSYPGATMAGTVGVSGCATALDPSSGSATIAADGSYSFQLAAGCTGGTFSLAALPSTNDLVYSVSAVGVFDAGTTNQVINVAVPPTVPLTISVIDTSNAPVPDAYVDLTKGAVWPTYPVTLTGAISTTGEYKLKTQGKGGARLGVTTGPDGKAEAQLPANSSSSLVASLSLPNGFTAQSASVNASVDGSGGSATVPIDITGPQFVTISGKVTAPAGQTLSGTVGVNYCTSSWGTRSSSSAIAPDGAYSFTLVSGCTGGKWALSVASDATPSLTYRIDGTGFTAPTSDLVANDIPYPDTFDTITVDVTDVTGKPVSGASAYVYPSATGWPAPTVALTSTFSGTSSYVSPNEGTTDGIHSLVFPVPASSTSDVTASVPLGNGGTAKATNVGIASGASTTLVLDTTTPTVETVTLSGAVTQDGKPAFTGTVSVSNCMASQVATHASAPIQEDGSFSLPVVAGCTGGALVVDAYPIDVSDRRLSLSTGYTFNAPATPVQVTIDVPATVPLTIHVTEASGSAVEGASTVARVATWPVYSAPVAGTTLQGGYYMGGGGKGSRALTGTTDAMGNFTLRVPANSTTDVYASIALQAGLRAAGAVMAAPASTTAIQVSVPLTGAEVLSAGSSTGSIGITAPEGTVQDATATTAPQNAVPAGATDLTGSVAYNLTGLTPGATATVSVTLTDTPSTPTALYKNVNGTWVDLSSIATFDGQVVTLTVTDGGLGDSDGLANGTIADPLVLADIDANTLASLRSAVPSAPIAPTTAPTGTGVTLQWTAPASSWNLITGYDVQVATKASGPFSAVTSGTCAGTVKSTQCTATLAGGKTYYFQVRAKDAAGPGPWSATSVGTTTSLAAALKPTFGTVTRTATGFTVNVTNYNPAYMWAASTNAGTVTVGTPTGSTLPLTVTALTAGQSATVTVTTSRTGYASGSAAVSGTALASTPSAPQNVTATGGSKQAAISWTAPASTGGSAITKYTATAWSTSSSGIAAGTCSATKGATSCTISKLNAKTTYWVDVSATNAVGTGPASVRISVLTTP